MLSIRTRSNSGFQPTIFQQLLFVLLFLALAGALGVIAWIWPGGVFEFNPDKAFTTGNDIILANYSGDCVINFGGYNQSGVDTEANAPGSNCHYQRIGFCVGILIIFIGCEMLWFRWFPAHLLRLTSRKHSLKNCTWVLITATDRSKNPCPVYQVYDIQGSLQRIFYFRNCKFAWHQEKNKWIVVEPVMGPPVLLNQDGKIGLKQEESERAIAWFGPNLIDVPLPSIPTLLLQEVLNPFIWFQIFSVTIWFN